LQKHNEFEEAHNQMLRIVYQFKNLSLKKKTCEIEVYLKNFKNFFKRASEAQIILNEIFNSNSRLTGGNKKILN